MVGELARIEKISNISLIEGADAIECDHRMGEVAKNSEGVLEMILWEFPGAHQGYKISRKIFGSDKKLFKNLEIIRLNDALEDTGYKLVRVEAEEQENGL